MVPVNVSIPSVGLITIAKFAELSGVDEGVVLGWAKKGHLPMKKIGRYSLVNLVALHSELLESDYSVLDH